MVKAINKNMMDDEEERKPSEERAKKRKGLLKKTSSKKSKKSKGFEYAEGLVLHLKRETKGTYFYEAVENNYIQSLYLKKACVGDGKAPKSLRIEIASDD